MSTLVDYIRSNWHEVPEGIVIPDDVEFVVVGDHWGVVTPIGAGESRERLRSSTPPDDITRFTPEPLPVEPVFELPTTPGALIIAHDDKDETRRVFLRTSWGHWADSEGFWSDDKIRDPQPAIAVLTEAWERLRVLDPEDRRDRVDRKGHVWSHYSGYWWDGSGGTCTNVGGLHHYYGPLRFADEETQR